MFLLRNEPGSMIRQAAPYLVALLLSAGPAISVMAQSSAPPAEAESVRREEAYRLLGPRLEQADRDVAAGRLSDAARRYEDAYSLALRVGSKADAERDRAIAGVASTRIQLARSAEKRGYLNEAAAHAERALKVDPTNQEAAALKQEYDRLLAKRRGMTPSADTLGQLPEIRETKVQVNTLVQDARVFLEAGELEKAEVKLREALDADPSHEAANYYMKLTLDAQASVEAKRRAVLSKYGLLMIDEVWNQPLVKDKLPAGNPFATTNLVHTSKGRQIIKSKLERIRLDDVRFEELPLSEVVRYLKEEAKTRDPEGLGINFFINPYLDNVQSAGTVATDPNTGQLITIPATEQINLNDVTIRIDPALNNVRMVDAIDAITKSASSPIKVTIEDYAVVFMHKAPTSAQLVTRIFKVNPNTFESGLESVSGITFGDFQTGTGGAGGGGGGGGGGGQGGQGGGVVGTIIPRVFVTGNIIGGQGGGGGGFGGGGGGFGGGGGGGGSNGLRGVTIPTPAQTVQEVVRTFFAAAGVNLLPPNAVFFNDRLGLLMVRATVEEIEVVEQAIEVLNAAAPMVQIEAKFAEVGQDDLKALGFDWMIGNWLIGNGGAIGVSPGTAPSYQGRSSAANPSGIFPGPADATGVPGPGAVPASGTDGVLTSGLRQTVGSQGANIPTLATITGLMTDPQFRVAVRALEQRGALELMAAPRVTTLSGRQAQVQINDLRTIVTGVDLNQTASGGTTAGAVGGGLTTGGGGVAPTLNYVTQITPFGPVLDVIPYVAADGYTIELTIIPTFSEFLGYDDPGLFVPQAQSVAGSTIGLPITAQLPLPRLRVRQVVTSAMVWDGQTVVIGGLISEDIRKQRDKVPFLGDLPWLGRLFRTESTQASKRNLMIFITPTIIDPAGNPIHTPDNLPFDPNILPEQPQQRSN